jgi:hypothetical protein
MKTIKDSFKSRMPKVKYDPALDKYEGLDLFPEKTAKANEILKKTGHPPQII